MAGVLDGRVAPTPLESALAALARATCDRPARLGPDDLAPLRALVGDGALDYALVAATFHFVNRIADLLGVEPEVPGLAWLRRAETVRRASVRAMAWLLGRMELAPRPYARTFEEALAMLPSRVDRTSLAVLAPRPKLVEAIALAIDERERRSSLDRRTLARIDATVAAALPATADDARGFHARPQDPVESFAFVGTRYAARTTAATIDALRRAGFDDLHLLDLAVAVADANQWERLRRLTGLPAAIFAPSRT